MAEHVGTGAVQIIERGWTAGKREQQGFAGAGDLGACARGGYVPGYTALIF